MLANATLLRIDTPLPATAAGLAQWTTGETISPGIRCFVGNDASSDAYAELARLTEGRGALLRIEMWKLAFAGLVTGVECRVSVQQDGDAPVLYRVRDSRVRSKGSLSFFEAVLMRD